MTLGPIFSLLQTLLPTTPDLVARLEGLNFLVVEYRFNPGCQIRNSLME